MVQRLSISFLPRQRSTRTTHANLFADQLNNVEEEIISSERIATAPLLGLDRVEGRLKVRLFMVEFVVKHGDEKKGTA